MNRAEAMATAKYRIQLKRPLRLYSNGKLRKENIVENDTKTEILEALYQKHISTNLPERHKELITLRVKKISPVGFNHYPALKNIDTGKIYVDTSLGAYKNNAFTIDHDYNTFGEYIGYNIPGTWCTFHLEPEIPLKHNIHFDLYN